MRVLVCGGRDYRDGGRVREELNKIDGELERGIHLVIQGGALGADRAAENWALDHEVPTVRVNAQWSKYGRKAGPLRNRRMLIEWDADLVLAFPGGRGTQNMVDLAKEYNCKVVQIRK